EAPTLPAPELLEILGVPVERKEWHLVLQDSTLLSAGSVITLAGTGIRLHAEQSLLVSSDQAIELLYPPNVSYFDTRCNLEHVTVAARRAVLSLEEDSKTGARVIDPIRIEIKNSVFLNPFVRDNGKTPATAAVLVAPESALWRGALLWRSDGDAFD